MGTDVREPLPLLLETLWQMLFLQPLCQQGAGSSLEPVFIIVLPQLLSGDPRDTTE